MKVFVFQWYGPFHNLDDIRDWESDNGDDTYLYIFRGKKKNAKKYTYYCGQAFYQSAGKRMKNTYHHVQEVIDRSDVLDIWVGKIVNTVPGKDDVNKIENLLISFMHQYLISPPDEMSNETNYYRPQCQIYIINEWYNTRTDEIPVYKRGSLCSLLPDVIAHYPHKETKTSSVYCAKKLSYITELK